MDGWVSRFGELRGLNDLEPKRRIELLPYSVARKTLTERRVRHLPVLNDGALAGMISIGDVVKAKDQELSVENHYLKEYINR